uniref:Secreted protein n=1 Tax=Arundo donax TaxID=35708 RepID=A0A0A9D2Q0_ARUDO
MSRCSFTIILYSNTFIFLFTPAVAKNSLSRSNPMEHTKFDEFSKSQCFSSARTFNLLNDKYLHNPSRKEFTQPLCRLPYCPSKGKSSIELPSVPTAEPVALLTT